MQERTNYVEKIDTVGSSPDIASPLERNDKAVIDLGFADSFGLNLQVARERANELTADVLGMNPLRDGGKTLTPDQVNARYPYFPEAITEAMSELRAEELSRRHLERREREMLLSGSGFIGGSLGGMLGWASDPMNALGIVAGNYLMKGAATWMTGSQSFASLGRFLLNDASFASRYAKEALGGALGEIPIAVAQYNKDSKEYQDASVAAAFKQIALGAIVGPLMGEGLRFGVGNIKAAPQYMQALAQGGFKNFYKSFKEANILINLGKRVDFSALDKELDAEKVGTGNVEAKFYAAHSEPHLESEILGKDYGEGFYASADPDYVNNHISHPEREKFGEMIEYTYNPKEVKLLDADAEKVIKPETELIAEGYDGIKFKDGNADVVKFFDPTNKKLKAVNHFEANLGQRARVTSAATKEATQARSDMLASLRNEKTDLFHDEEAFAKFDEELAKGGVEEPIRTEDIQKEVDEMVVEFTNPAAKNITVDAGMKAEVDLIKETATNIEKRAQIERAAAFCMRL